MRGTSQVEHGIEKAYQEGEDYRIKCTCGFQTSFVSSLQYAGDEFDTHIADATGQPTQRSGGENEPASRMPADYFKPVRSPSEHDRAARASLHHGLKGVSEIGEAYRAQCFCRFQTSTVSSMQRAGLEFDTHIAEILEKVTPGFEEAQEAANEGPPPATPKRRTALTVARYQEGYTIARAIDRFGGVIKDAALIIGSLLALIGLIVCFNNSAMIGIPLIFLGLLAGGIGYILGILVQSAGQLMKALFDVAVNGSHFLTDDQRAKVMSLE